MCEGHTSAALLSFAIQRLPMSPHTRIGIAWDVNDLLVVAVHVKYWRQQSNGDGIRDEIFQLLTYR